MSEGHRITPRRPASFIAETIASGKWYMSQANVDPVLIISNAEARAPILAYSFVRDSLQLGRLTSPTTPEEVGHLRSPPCIELHRQMSVPILERASNQSLLSVQVVNYVFITFGFGPRTVSMKEKIAGVRTLLIIDENSVSVAHRRFVHDGPTMDSNVNAWQESDDF